MKNKLNYFLHLIFRAYFEGIDLDLKGLYPKVSYPVGRGTPMISPMIKWDHSEEWQVPNFAKVIYTAVYPNSFTVY